MSNFMKYLNEQIRYHHSELKKLKIAKKAYKEAPILMQKNNLKGRRRFVGKTIQSCVLDLLRTEPDREFHIMEILDALRETYSADLVRTSLSPQLSRLKQDGEVIFQNSKWKLYVQGDKK